MSSRDRWQVIAAGFGVAGRRGLSAKRNRKGRATERPLAEPRDSQLLGTATVSKGSTVTVRWLRMRPLGGQTLRAGGCHLLDHWRASSFRVNRPPAPETLTGRSRQLLSFARPNSNVGSQSEAVVASGISTDSSWPATELREGPLLSSLTAQGRIPPVRAENRVGLLSLPPADQEPPRRSAAARPYQTGEYRPLPRHRGGRRP